MTEAKPVRAWLAGGTGLVGSALLAQLQSHPHVATIDALCRQSPPVSPPGVQWRPWSWLDEGGDMACDVAFSCLGTTHKQAGSKAAFAAVDRDLVLRFAERAQQAGAQRFGLVSSVGASSTARSHYMRIKGEVEDRLCAMGFSALHIVQPSLLLGARKDTRV
ncbi:MAG: NAD-dependent epimerase/dehydratase family protein, partial [Algiphilus sp.]